MRSSNFGVPQTPGIESEDWVCFGIAPEVPGGEGSGQLDARLGLSLSVGSFSFSRGLALPACVKFLVSVLADEEVPPRYCRWLKGAEGAEMREVRSHGSPSQITTFYSLPLDTFLHSQCGVLGRQEFRCPVLGVRSPWGRHRPGLEVRSPST